MIASNENQLSFNGIKRPSSCLVMDYAPHGDFAELLTSIKFYRDEILARTFFRHLIEGLQYLHSKNISHMDIKLENILLGEDLNLKIIDFDLSYIEGDRIMPSHGTPNYRAPELKSRTCLNAKPTDLYSAGVLLFVFRTGAFPYTEDGTFNGIDCHALMRDDSNKFWELHKKLQRDMEFDEDFKELFISLTKFDPTERISFENIKNNLWYKGEIYSNEELHSKLTHLGVKVDLPSDTSF